MSNDPKDDDDIQIEVIDNPPEVDASAAPAAPAPKVEKAPEVTPDDGIDALKSNLAAEKARREAAEQAARKANEEAEQAKAGSRESDYATIINAMEARKTAMGSIKRDIADAYRSGDFDRVADLNETLAEHRFRLAQLEDGKDYLDKQRAAPQPQIQRQAPTDPVEAAVRTLTPSAAAWVRSHPECVTDPTKNALMTAGHYEAVASGMQTDTPEYFAHIEAKLGYRAPAPAPVPAPTPAPAPVYVQRDNGGSVQPPAAPAASSAAAIGGANQRGTVRLTKAQMDFCKETGTDPKSYARGLLKAQERGLMGA